MRRLVRADSGHYYCKTQKNLAVSAPQSWSPRPLASASRRRRFAGRQLPACRSMVAVTDAYSCCALAEGCRLSGQPSHLSSRCIDKCLNRYAGPPPAWRCFPFFPAWDMSQPIQISPCEWSAGVAYRDAILHPAAIFAQKKYRENLFAFDILGPDRTNARNRCSFKALFCFDGPG